MPLNGDSSLRKNGTNVKKGKPTFSHRIPCVDGKIAVSPNGQLFATKTSESLVLYYFSTLKSHIVVPAPYSIKFLKFSLDGKYIGWLSLDPYILRLCELQTKSVLEIDVKPGLEVMALIFGPKCVIYVSELEIYLGVYDFGSHKSFTLEGCSLDDFDRPLLQFSPKGDYLCLVRGHQTVMYNTDCWNLVTVFSCPVCPIVPVFVNPYTVFMTNHEGVISWFSAFGSNLKTESVLQSRCIVDVELSKDGRQLLASTYDNKVICYDTVSMEGSLLLEYIFNIEPQHDVRVFSVTETIEEESPVFSKYNVNNHAVLKEVKNLMDEFKMKCQNKNLMSLNHDDTLLATVTPLKPHVIWIWDLLKTKKLKVLIRLHNTAGRIRALRWHHRTNRLAISCSNLVVIWSDRDFVALPGENVTFRWLNLKVPVGIVASAEDCRFACF